MESALAWIGQIAEWVGQFVPRIRNVHIGRKGIKHRRGTITILDPGLHVFWPLTTDWDDWPVVRQGEVLREQTLVTTDDRAVVVGGMLIHEIVDLSVLVSTCYSPVSTVRDIAMTAVHDVCCQMSWEELKGEQRRGTLDTKLKNEAQKALTSYGVRVVKLMLTDLSPCKVLRLVQTGAVKGDD